MNYGGIELNNLNCYCTQNPWSSGRLQILLILSRFEVVVFVVHMVSTKKKYSDATYAEDYFSSTN